MTIMCGLDECVQRPAKIVLSLKAAGVNVGIELIEAADDVNGTLDLVCVLGGRVL
jgi:hypothetical protein